MRLIRNWLRAPIMINGKLVKRRKGVPQGSPLSPLLSNIMLNELDRFFERQGIRFVRYADDFSLYFKTKASAKQKGNKTYKFLRDKLKLPINREKSKICKPINHVILGFGFVPIYRKGIKGKYQLVVARKNWKKFKMKIKKITRKTTPMSFDERIQKLNQAIRGWINNFRIAHIIHKLTEIDGWMQKPPTLLHMASLEETRKEKEKPYSPWSRPYRSRLCMEQDTDGWWAVAQSPILGTTITLERLKKRGYISLLEVYLKISPQHNEPLYT